LGVKDDKTIVGVSITEETVQKWINEIKQNTEPAVMPDVDIFNTDNKTVVIFKIKEFPIKPIACKGRFYIRKQNSNHQLSAQEISEAYMHSMQYSWDSYLFGEVTLKDIDTKLVNNFIAKVNAVKRFNLPDNLFDALKKLKFVKNGLPTNGAIILFSKDILKYNVHIGRFKTGSHIISDDMLSGDLYSVLNESMNKIISHLKFAFEITGETTRRTEIPEYPLEAIRELLVNTLVHRDNFDC